MGKSSISMDHFQVRKLLDYGRLGRKSWQVNSGSKFWYPLAMTNSSPWYRWPIEIDGLPNLKMVIFHGKSTTTWKKILTMLLAGSTGDIFGTATLAKCVVRMMV